jgi:signal transduction histidine kinase
MTTGVLHRRPAAIPSPPVRSSRRVATDLVGMILRVPLLGKLLGANLLIVGAAILGHFVMPLTSTVLELTLALSVSFSVTALLTWLALRPVAELEATADRVTLGDFSARVPPSRLADRDIQRLSVTLNRLLDRVESDRARIQYLAGRSVRARDIERATVARELRDSLAQLVAAIGMQVTAAQSANASPEVEQQLERVRTLIGHLGDEMRMIAESLHPGTMVELGLANAIAVLVRRASRATSPRIQLDHAGFTAPASAQAAGALYRVADEALRNVQQHADATNVRVTLRSSEGAAVLEIEDDGRGMDFREADPLQAGLGLFSARAVLALAGGDLQISSATGKGTLVRATVPLNNDRTLS